MERNECDKHVPFRFMQIHTELFLHFAVGEERKHAHVLYVDFGNCDHVAESDLQALPKAFCQIPAYTIPCALSQVSYSND